MNGRCAKLVLAPLTSVILVAACSTSASERCNAQKQQLGCGRAYVDDHVCATEQGRCIVDCNAHASCAELDRTDRGIWPAWLELCLDRCLETIMCKDDGRAIPSNWRCDGQNDCVDGSDERHCSYFLCEDGVPIAENSACNGWRECNDGSDENDCGYFLCADNSQRLASTARCNGDSECDDGSDERGCF